MQGIFITDQAGGKLPYSNLVVKNNTLVGTHWHGITIMSASGTSVTGNVLVTIPGTTIDRTWVRLSGVSGVLRENTGKSFVLVSSPNVKQATNTINTSSTAFAAAAI